MRYRSPGRHKTFESFRVHLESIDASFDAAADPFGPTSALAQPFMLGARTIGNRFAAHPMEGWDGTTDGLPTELTLRRWRRFGRSGAKLVWGGEAFAVQADGRANPNQLFLNPGADSAGGLAALLAELRAGHVESGLVVDDLFVGLQLTHSGRFSRPAGGAAPRPAFRHPVLDERFEVSPDVPLVTDAELEGIGERYIEAAQLAREVGFDFVDIKCCHGYLLHELLAARARPGPYGGSLENRTRFLRQVIDGVRSAAPGLEIGARVSIADVFPHIADEGSRVGEPRGWREHVPYRSGFGVDENDPRRFDLEEPMQLLATLRERGVRLVNVSLGSPYYCPHLPRPATYPPSDGYLPPDDPLREVTRHLAVTRACKRAFGDLAFVGSGYTYLQEWLPHVAQHEVASGGVDFVGIGRMLLSYPELPLDTLRGGPLDRKKLCRTFSDCTTGPRNGMPSGCYPLDPHYRARPEAARIAEIKKGLRS